MSIETVNPYDFHPNMKADNEPPSRCSCCKKIGSDLYFSNEFGLITKDGYCWECWIKNSGTEVNTGVHLPSLYNK